MVSTACNFGIGISVALLAALGIGFTILSCSAPSLVYNIAKEQANFRISDVLENFIEPPVPVYQRVYMFNLTNHDEVVEGKPPRVEQLGPYVFRIDMAKQNLTWRKDLLKFSQYKAFKFVPKLSTGSLDDPVQTVNPMLISVYQTLQQFNAPKENRSLFFTKTVKELLYYGFDDPTLNTSTKVSVPLNDGRAGYLVGTNDTSDEVYEVFTGYVKDTEDAEQNETVSEQFNNIYTFKGKRTNTFYKDKCNALEGIAIEGTNGELFPPFEQPPEHVTLFNPQLCRPWKLHFRESVKKNGLNVARFEARNDFFTIQRTGDKKIDTCMEQYRVDHNGTFDASACQNSVPVILSLPHFFGSDASILDDVKGLNPNREEHGIYLDIYPRVGFTVDMRIRIQVNFKLAGGLEDGNMTSALYPIFWQEIMLYPEDSGTAAGELYQKVEKPRDLVVGITASLAALFMVLTVVTISVGLWLRHRDKQNSKSINVNSSRTGQYSHTTMD